MIVSRWPKHLNSLQELAIQAGQLESTTMEKFIIRMLANKPAIAPKHLTDRDIQLFSDAVKHIATGLKVGDFSRIETALQYLRIIEKKVK